MQFEYENYYMLYCIRETWTPYVRYKFNIGVSVFMKKRHVALAAAVCMALLVMLWRQKKMMMLI